MTRSYLMLSQYKDIFQASHYASRRVLHFLFLVERFVPVQWLQKKKWQDSLRTYVEALAVIPVDSGGNRL